MCILAFNYHYFSCFFSQTLGFDSCNLNTRSRRCNIKIKFIASNLEGHGEDEEYTFETIG